jgi:hypothetical protein
VYSLWKSTFFILKVLLFSKLFSFFNLFVLIYLFICYLFLRAADIPEQKEQDYLTLNINISSGEIEYNNRNRD